MPSSRVIAGARNGRLARFSPRTNFIYHHARYAPTTFYTTPTNTSGGTFPGWGSTTEDVPGVDYGLYGAVDSTTGKIVWKIKVSQALSGMTVGGDLVFFGDNSGLVLRGECAYRPHPVDV